MGGGARNDLERPAVEAVVLVGGDRGSAGFADFDEAIPGIVFGVVTVRQRGRLRHRRHVTVAIVGRRLPNVADRGADGGDFVGRVGGAILHQSVQGRAFGDAGEAVPVAGRVR